MLETGIPADCSSAKEIFSYLLISDCSDCICCNVSSIVASGLRMTRRGTVLIMTPVIDSISLIGASEAMVSIEPRLKEGLHTSTSDNLTKHKIGGATMRRQHD